jgi:outer membrane receptor protein involved in Fe transport
VTPSLKNTGLILGLWPVMGLAQVAVPAPPASAASAPATQTITVTGERAGRTLAETTTSVTVLPEAEVRRRGGKQGVYGAIDGAPNFTPSAPEELPPIRGERSSGPSSLGGSFLFGSTTRASLIVDDVARISSYSNSSFQSIFDLDQVELLRGPQTTVRGANAIAGAFVVKTKDPTRRREGELMLQADHNAFSDVGWRWAAMGNSPVGDSLAARVVVERRAGRTPVEVYDGTGFDPALTAPPPGTDLEALSKFDRTSLRTKFLVTPADVPELDVLVTLSAERGRDLGFDSYVNGPGIHGRPLRDRKYIFG